MSEVDLEPTSSIHSYGPTCKDKRDLRAKVKPTNGGSSFDSEFDAEGCRWTFSISLCSTIVPSSPFSVPSVGANETDKVEVLMSIDFSLTTIEGNGSVERHGANVEHSSDRENGVHWHCTISSVRYTPYYLSFTSI
jgi:hypothetical protein